MKLPLFGSNNLWYHKQMNKLCCIYIPCSVSLVNGTIHKITIVPAELSFFLYTGPIQALDFG